MKILILGGDGYLGWPTAMKLSVSGHEVTVIDNYLRRRLSEKTNSCSLIYSKNLTDKANLFYRLTGCKINVIIGDLADPEVMFSAVRQSSPDAIVHYAEQPSAPFSMIGFRKLKDFIK